MFRTSAWKHFRFFFRPRRFTREPIELGPNKIYILPTKTGLGYCFLLLVMLLVSINYNNAPGYMLTFLLVGIGLVSIFHVHRNISGLRISSGRTSPVFAGSRACFPVTVTNPSSFARHAIRVGWSARENRFAPGGKTGQEADSSPGAVERLSEEPAQTVGQCLDIEAFQEAEYAPFLPAPARGLLRPSRIAVSTVYPLGLYRAWSWVALPLRCVVYPTPDSHAPPLPSRHPSSPADQDLGNQAGREHDEYDGLRPYQQGDPLRRIAWKAVARGDDLVSKMFAGNVQETFVALDWNDLPMQETETRLSRLCRHVLDAEGSGLTYALRIPGRRIPPGSGPGHMHACLTALALFGLNPDEIS